MNWIQTTSGGWETTTPAGIHLILKPNTDRTWSLYHAQYLLGIYDTADECKKWIHDKLMDLQYGRTGCVE